MIDYPEYTLTLPPPCPRNQDHLRLTAGKQSRQATLGGPKPEPVSLVSPCVVTPYEVFFRGVKLSLHWRSLTVTGLVALLHFRSVTLQGGCQFSHSPRPVVVGFPIPFQQLRRCTSLEQLAWTVEPTPDSDIVVCTRKLGHDEGNKMEANCDRIGRGPSTGEVATGA